MSKDDKDSYVSVLKHSPPSAATQTNNKDLNVEAPFQQVVSVAYDRQKQY